MTLREDLQPVDAGGAGRAIFAMVGSGSLITFAGALITMHGSRSGIYFAVLAVTLAAACVAAFALRRLPADHPAWPFVPLLNVAGVVVLFAAVPSPALHTELFLWFPAMYFARQTRRQVAWVGIGMCVLTAAGMYLVRYDLRTAVLGIMYLGSTLGLITVRTTNTGKRIANQLSVARAHATTDSLTGLLTRRSFEETATIALRRGASHHGAAFVLVDVDGFKEVNDTFGHPGGDHALVQLGQLLRGFCRSDDIVARFGGDELAVLFYDIPLALLVPRLEAIRTEVAEHSFVMAGSPAALTVSIGAAHARQGPSGEPASTATLYDRADRALYSAKRRGRNRAELFTAEAWQPTSRAG